MAGTRRYVLAAPLGVLGVFLISANLVHAVAARKCPKPATTSPTPTPTWTPTATVAMGYRAGDSNCDGAVSPAELPGVLVRVGSPPSPLCGADTNGDRVVDAQDLPQLIARLFGD